MSAVAGDGAHALRTIETDIPARMDRLRFRAALKEGVERGEFRKTGHKRYAPAG